MTQHGKKSTHTGDKLPDSLKADNIRIGIVRPRLPPLMIVEEASFDVHAGKLLGIVGESGSGKTMLCRSLIGTLERHRARLLSGSIRLDGQEIANVSEATWRRIRGREIGYVPQSALAGPNPILKIKTQLVEAIRAWTRMSRQNALREARRLLDLVKIPRPDIVLEQYPHQLSGGMRQRVMIAAALAQQPKVLVADEPTTGLDVTVQHEIMLLLEEIRREFRTAMILVSHDLALIEDFCHSIMVMHAGASVEKGSVETVSTRPRHPYTVALYESRIDLAEPGSKLVAIGGEPPAVGEWPAGCRFWPRCRLATDECRVNDHPALTDVTDESWNEVHMSACLFWPRVGEAVARNG